MNVARAREVVRVLSQLFAVETARTVGLGMRRGRGDTVDRQQQRARAVRLALERLGPFYVKVGQLLSTRPDVVPDYMCTEFEHLHSRVSVAPFSEFAPVLEDELGRDWQRLFKELVTDTPLGAASLAQVYRATLRTGEAAVVKIQRPGIAPIMLDDMAMLKSAARQLARRAPNFNDVIDIEAMLEVMFTAMAPELDFRVEANNMDEGRDLVEEFDTLAVPEVIFVTPKVMVQSLAPGMSIRDINRDDFAKEDREAIGRDLLALMYRGFYVDRFFHADPHPGNVFIAPGEKAHLIDWGMCGRLDKQISLAHMMTLLHIGQNDGAGAAKAWIEMGRATSAANIPAFINDMAGYVPTLSRASMEDLNLGLATTAMLRFSTRRGIQTPPVVALLGKAFHNIEGSVRYLAPELSMFDVFEEEFQDILFDVVRELLSSEQAATSALHMVLGALAAPEQVRTLLRDLTNRELTLNINQAQGRRTEDRADARMKSLQRTLFGLGAAALWIEHRHRQSR